MSGSTSPRAALLRDKNFKWLMRGGVISLLGDQLSMIALPWLVLQLTGDPLALGMVIALMSIPRAVFILLGGALVDRYSPKRVLMLSKYANAVLLAVLTLLVWNHAPTLTLPLWPSLSLTVAMTPHIVLNMIYVLAFGIGLAQAFGIPSGTSIMPQVIAAEHLQTANGMLMGLRQLSMLLGPLLAAGLLALSGHPADAGDAGHAGAAMADRHGLALAFGVDCLSFVLSAWTLSKVVPLKSAVAEQSSAAGQLVQLVQPVQPVQPVLRAVAEGIAMVWNDLPLRLCFCYWGIVALLVGGVMQVALPVLASDQLQGASTLGLMMASHGAGTLLGMAGAAVGGARLRFASFGTLMLLIDALVGVLVMPLGAVQAVWQAAVLMLAIGVLAGFMQINVFTWIQRRVPPHMMGRAMSIFMFVFMGLAPLSAAVTGWILRVVTLSQLFVGGGMILVTFAALAYMFTPIRAITSTTNDTPAGTPAQ